MPDNLIEYRYRAFSEPDIQVRVSGDGPGAITGPVINYGDVAVFPWGKERFEPGTFKNLENADLIANRMHRRTQILARTGAGYTVHDGPTALRSEVNLPDTQIGRDTCTEVRLGLLKGKSMEFRAVRDRVEDGVRIVSEALYFGEGIVDRPAYGGSWAQMRSWDEYRQAVEYRDAFSGLYLPYAVPGTLEARSCGGCCESRGENLGNLLRRLRDEKDLSNAELGEAAGVSASTMGGIIRGDINCPPRQRLEGLADLLDVPAARLIRAAESDGCSYQNRSQNAEMRFAAFDCEFEVSNDAVRFRMPYGSEEAEIRQVEDTELTGRLPYGVDGVISMQRGELVRFLPGAFTDSLAGEIILLAGNSYEEPLANSLEGTLRLRDSDEALEFEARDLPDTTYSRNFLGKLSKGLIRGLTAGWANAGSDTTTEELPDGGKRIVVRKATLCEFYPRSRSVAPGGGVAARRRRVRSDNPDPKPETRERVVF